MIARPEIDAMAERLDVHASHVQRDYVHGWILSTLFRESPLASQLVLKGGNCLRKGYFENARYSRDLDFSTSRGISNEDLGNALNEICRSLSAKSGLEFDLEQTRVERKPGADEEKQISEARLYFRDFYGEKSELLVSVRVDVTQHDRLYLPVQAQQLIHPYSDSDQCNSRIQCVKLEELLAAKLRCLLQRRHIADFYDLIYATTISGELPVDRQELIQTFYNLTVFRRSPGVAKGLLIDLPFEALSRLWDRFIRCPLESRFSFETAQSKFLSLINLLIGDPAIRDRSDIYFASSVRAPIIDAAGELKMVKFAYDGIERLVEPYSMTFKTPQGRPGREYFYGYDTTGGKTSGPGLKTFVPGKLMSVELINQHFEPRYEVELRKAGSSEQAGRFEAQRRPRSRISRVRSIIGFRVQCPNCQKIFNRESSYLKLNPHKDRYGGRCPGRHGYPV